MSDWNSKGNGFDGDIKPLKRWEKIMSLPENTPFYDISTGKAYRRGMFRPVHRNDFENIVEEFQILGTEERVFVPFLRLVGDTKYCSLVKAG
jgi:hypothetical protein